MATKQDEVAKEPTTAPELVNEGREPTVQEAPDTTFDERTPGTPPFVREDGSHNNGDVVESKPVVEKKTKK